ncbi:MAG TPA: heparan-alpha-glucosaminide N-acetyltransferase domain-containing protein [Chitinophagaceae bacterium]|nr:heparan-alpha-glucosaminide N-acetyltransferase domain-containing protein [Chitinophagaceae bacterium]
MTKSLAFDKKRITSVDLLRGVIMIIMALDHTREFFHSAALNSNPLDLNTTTPVLFFTRWITHICAPVFVFLSGTSAFLQSARKSKRQLSLFLITRGIWLIIAEVAIVNLIFSFDISYSAIALEVIWAIGISMVILGLVIWLPFEIILAIGLLIVLGHNALDFYERDQTTPFSAGYNLVHRVGFHSLWGKHQLLILYPFLPWSGLMMLGYCLGKVLRNDNVAYRKKFLVITGISVIGLFIILRFINVYGDPFPWSQQGSAFYTFLSFINTSKYPPSLFFIAMTIGPALLLMAWWDNIQNEFTRIVSVYGRVPFFYFLTHFFIIHLFSAVAFFMRGHTFAEDAADVSTPFIKFIKEGEGVQLRYVYLIWLAVVIILYPVCKWYDNYKTRHKEKKWLSYL